MARHFVDTSALVKLYRDELNSPAVPAVISTDDRLVICELALLEFRSALHALVRRREMSGEHARTRIALFEQDRRNYEIVPLTSVLAQNAMGLLDQFGIAQGLRPPDALQLAAAQQAAQTEMLDAMVTTDGILATCACALGLTVLP